MRKNTNQKVPIQDNSLSERGLINYLQQIAHAIKTQGFKTKNKFKAKSGQLLKQQMDEDIQSFSQELNKTMQGIDEKLKNELSTLEKRCMERNDIDKFVTCMESTVEKIEREQKNLEFRMAFLQYNTQECFKRSKEGKIDFGKCKEQTKSAVNNYIEMFLFNVRK